MKPTPTPDALVIVDVQNDFCEGGALAVAGGSAIVRPINRLARDFPLVILTQDWHPAGHSSFASSHPGKAPFESVTAFYGEQTLWPDHCIQDSEGAAFHPDLHVPMAQMVVRKGVHPAVDSYSAFFENDRTTPTGLAGALRERGVGRVVLCGLALDFCVAYSALDARRLGFEVTVFEDLCAGIDLGGSLSRMRAAMREEGVVLTRAGVPA